AGDVANNPFFDDHNTSIHWPFIHDNGRLSEGPSAIHSSGPIPASTPTTNAAAIGGVRINTIAGTTSTAAFCHRVTTMTPPSSPSSAQVRHDSDSRYLSHASVNAATDAIDTAWLMAGSTT